MWRTFLTFRKLKNDIFHLGPLERENEAIHIRKHLNHYANVLNELISPRNVSKNLPPHLIAASHVRLRPTHPDAIAVALDLHPHIIPASKRGSNFTAFRCRWLPILGLVVRFAYSSLLLFGRWFSRLIGSSCTGRHCTPFSLSLFHSLFPPVSPGRWWWSGALPVPVISSDFSLVAKGTRMATAIRMKIWQAAQKIPIQNQIRNL